MKKLFFLTLVGSIILAGCSQQTPTEDPELIKQGGIQTEINQNNTEFNLFSPKTKNHTYTRKMQQPNLEEMNNRNAMINGFNKQRNTTYTIKQEDTTKLEYCPEGIRFISDEEAHQAITPKEIIPGTKFTITGTRKSDNLLSLTNEQQKSLENRGRTLANIQQFTNRQNTSYDESRANDISYEEERNKVYHKIGGQEMEYKRYPFNTVLFTNDMLLHVYHKLFDNSLKYYEETIARPILTQLSQKLYLQFLEHSKYQKEAQATAMYEFLAAYRAIPHILLPTQQEILDLLYSQGGEGDISDTQIQTLIRQRATTITNQFSEPYQTLIPQLIEKILKADSTEIDQFLTIIDSQDFFQQENLEIKQDYTQFKPRSHYNDSSLLKTYFMAMKWLMREKFYFGSENLTKAALIMVTSLDETDKSQIGKLAETIKNLIGKDDDLNIEKLLTYAKENNFDSTENIINNLNSQHLTQLSTLYPQKIQSTAYSTQESETIDEEQAKQVTNGFVFFGEKFTLDSYLFDITTAGSAEKEFTYKPNIQTALITPDILENNSIANQLVHLWLNDKQQTGNVYEDASHTQNSSYENVKQEALQKIQEIIADSEITNNIYHKRLSLLGRLLVPSTENDPYFKQDPLYQLKNLITYMGSYTELKHDTLLYVKQAYAEMGAGGGGDCDIYVQTPALPIPKGYIEAEPDFIENLLQLSQQTTQYFDQDTSAYMLSKFEAFHEILIKLKKMSIQQQNNEIIADEDFEWMRTLESTLNTITLPIKTIGEPTQKESRGSIIADIFTSEGGNPLYEAIGRPVLLLLMVNDVNGARVVIGPIFTHYEFYQAENILSENPSRYTDQDRQTQFDNLPSPQGLSIATKYLLSGLQIQI